MKVINVKGTHDIYGDESYCYQYVVNNAEFMAELYSFKPVSIPVLEHSEVFVRGVGNSSDIVRKEMYTFSDKGQRSLTLRPEFTAGILRMIAQNKLYATNDLPLKYYYSGPVFRYERPQLGRYRQFQQFGVESIGSNSPYSDFEVILLAYFTLARIGFNDVTLKINSLGDSVSRDNYRQALKDYFSSHVQNMCEDCKSRFELNPLRILDCKDEDDQKIIAGAPKITDYLSEDSKKRLEIIENELNLYQINFELDPYLVRGLDYYSEIVFEFHYTSKKGINYGAIGAGGHYSSLLKEFDGPDLPGCGFSFGVERLVSILKDDEITPDIDTTDVYFMPLDKNSLSKAMYLATILRYNGVQCEVSKDSFKMSPMFKKAERLGAKYGAIIGENELNSDKVILKDLNKQEQTEYSTEDFIRFILSIPDEEHHCHCHECQDDDNHECECECNDEECHCHNKK